VGDVTVRKRIDELLSEPAVADLGYVADQRLVATALLGLQLLADELDQVKDRLEGTSSPLPPTAPAGAGDVGAQLDELTEQLKKLTKAVKKASKKR
jgi:hypothetical protein